MKPRTLFLIDGTSGAWKADLFGYLINYRADSCFVKKFTTRKRRSGERKIEMLLDLNFISEEQFSSRCLEYNYIYNGARYGFSRKTLSVALEKSPYVFVVVRNVEVIRSLVKDFSFVNVVSVFIYTDYDAVGRAVCRRP
jgi:guanylate kinase